MPACNNRGIVAITHVTHTAVSKERLDKHASTEMNSCNISSAVLSVRSVPKNYKKDKEDRLSQLSLETPPHKCMSLGAEELN
jgi:hypothetical protein